MSNISKIPFYKIRDEGHYKKIFQALERGFIKFGIDFYLVGATARDVWMKGVHEKNNLAELIAIESSESI